MASSKNSRTSLPPERIVAFLDILGFQELTIRMFTREPELIRSMRLLLQQILNPTTDFEPEGDRNIPRCDCEQMTSFSDSIVLSNSLESRKSRKEPEPGSPSHPVIEVWGLITTAAWLASALLTKGMLCRGGIAIGRTYHKGNIVFGLGMLKAYEIERTTAKYPRIVVDDQVIDVLRTWTHTTFRGVSNEEVLIPKDRNNPMPQLKQDGDGCWFIDIFYHLYFYWHDQRPRQFGRIREVIVKGLQQELAAESPKLDRLAKYRWLANEFNASIANWSAGGPFTCFGAPISSISI